MRQTEGYLPSAAVAFIDEIFKANSAILNTLLTILNERLFDNGSERSRVPLLCLVRRCVPLSFSPALCPIVSDARRGQPTAILQLPACATSAHVSPDLEYASAKSQSFGVHILCQTLSAAHAVLCLQIALFAAGPLACPSLPLCP